MNLEMVGRVSFFLLNHIDYVSLNSWEPGKSIEFLISYSMRVRTKIMFLAWCSVKMNTFRNLPGSKQPSWIFLVPTSCPRKAYCHSTDFGSGTHNLYDSAKHLTRPTISRFSIVHNRVATPLF